MFKKLLIATMAISAFGAYMSASAQTNAGLTRAQVREELVALEKAGYDPQGPQENYPQDLMSAEQRVAASAASRTAYGGASNGTSKAGSKAPVQ